MVSGSRNIVDAVIIGDGLCGLSTALELGRAGVTCAVLGARMDGVASTAAAGLLVPTVGDLPERVKPFFMASLDLYPAFVDSVREQERSLAIIEGLIERRAGGDCMHPRDGAIDNVRLVAAVRRSVEQLSPIELTMDAAESIDASHVHVAVTTSAGRRLKAAFVVIAAGAWAPALRGLPRPLPVFPLKGQMLALG